MDKTTGISMDGLKSDWWPSVIVHVNLMPLKLGKVIHLISKKSKKCGFKPYFIKTKSYNDVSVIDLYLFIESSFCSLKRTILRVSNLLKGQFCLKCFKKKPFVIEASKGKDVCLLYQPVSSSWMKTVHRELRIHVLSMSDTGEYYTVVLSLHILV